MFKNSSIAFVIGVLQLLQMFAIGNAAEIYIQVNGNPKFFEGTTDICCTYIQLRNVDDIKSFSEKAVIRYLTATNTETSRAVVVRTQDSTIFIEKDFKITLFVDRAFADIEENILAKNIVVANMENNIWTLHIKNESPNKIAELQAKLPPYSSFGFKAENFNLNFLLDGDFKVLTEITQTGHIFEFTVDTSKLMILLKHNDGKITTYKATYIPDGDGGKLFFDPERFTNNFAHGNYFQYAEAEGRDFSAAPLFVAINPASWNRHFSYDEIKVSIQTDAYQSKNPTGLEGTVFSKDQEKKQIVLEVEIQKLRNGTGLTMEKLAEAFKDSSKAKISGKWLTGGDENLVDYNVVGAPSEIKPGKCSMRAKLGYRITFAISSTK